MKVVIINLGDEVVSGVTINTNAAYLAQELYTLGFQVEKHISCQDKKDLFREILAKEIDRNDVIITTGGLGPTYDDFTKEIIGDVTQSEMILYDECLEHIKNRYQKHNVEMSESNLSQAYFPKGSTVFLNDNGTAPGMMKLYDNTHIISLPGPPNELIPMFKTQVLPILESLIDVKTIHTDYLVMGIGESAAEDKLKELYSINPSVYIAPYASIGQVRYRITARHKNVNTMNQLLLDACNEFERIMGDYIVGVKFDQIEEYLVDELVSNQLTISFAESCTGGLAVSKIVNVPNASSVLEGSFVTYSNSFKVETLNVSEETLQNYGAVSDECVREMALGLNQVTNSDIAIAISGIAGPTGGTDTKPVGLVHVGIYYNDEVHLFKKVFSGNRNIVRERAAKYALWLAWKLLK